MEKFILVGMSFLMTYPFHLLNQWLFHIDTLPSHCEFLPQIPISIPVQSKADSGSYTTSSSHTLVESSSSPILVLDINSKPIESSSSNPSEPVIHPIVSGPSLTPLSDTHLEPVVSSSPDPVIQSRSLSKPAPNHPMITRTKRGIFKPKALSIDLVNSEPSTVIQALSCPYWKAAMEEEYKARMDNRTWSLVDPPKERSPIECKGV